MNLSSTLVHLWKSQTPQGPVLRSAGPRAGRLGSGRRKRKFFAMTVLLPVLANVGCQHIGPPTIAEDRLAYNNALSTSWKQQILLNIVRLHYDDVVDFVDISAVQQNHTLTGTTQASLGATLFPWAPLIGNTLTPSLMGTRMTSDNPSITYAPQSGSDFTRNINAPIKPYEIFNLIEGGYRADYVLDLAAKSIDEFDNSPGTNFETVAKAIADAYYFQGDVSFPAEVQPDGGDKKVFMIIAERDSKPCPNCRSRYPVAAIREVLHLRSTVTKFEIVPGRHHKENEIAVQTRSVISAMSSLSKYVPSTKYSVANDPRPPLKVCTDCKKPRDSYAAIKYRGNWFWINWNDDRSNTSMVYLRTLLALADTGARPTAPVLTIPVSR